jgi:hypothetical protein
VLYAHGEGDLNHMTMKKKMSVRSGIKAGYDQELKVVWSAQNHNATRLTVRVRSGTKAGQEVKCWYEPA